jgi:hypothetical protein
MDWNMADGLDMNEAPEDAGIFEGGDVFNLVVGMAHRSSSRDIISFISFTYYI